MPTSCMTFGIAFCPCITGSGKRCDHLFKIRCRPPATPTVWTLRGVPPLCADARTLSSFSFGLTFVSSTVSHGLQSRLNRVTNVQQPSHRTPIESMLCASAQGGMSPHTRQMPVKRVIHSQEPRHAPTHMRRRKVGSHGNRSIKSRVVGMSQMALAIKERARAYRSFCGRPCR